MSLPRPTQKGPLPLPEAKPLASSGVRRTDRRLDRNIHTYRWCRHLSCLLFSKITRIRMYGIHRSRHGPPPCMPIFTPRLLHGEAAKQNLQSGDYRLVPVATAAAAARSRRGTEQIRELNAEGTGEPVQARQKPVDDLILELPCLSTSVLRTRNIIGLSWMAITRTDAIVPLH
ncbi:hypothetical protein J6590_001153 [Homalodisca vitripennis]|nr:hypothetical protein J6590_001153 [Homalodisca vitripennis]